MNRRFFLQAGATTLATLGLTGCSSVARASSLTQSKAMQSNRKPRNIIFMVSDGMSMGVPSLTEPFSQILRGQGTQFAALMKNPSTTLGFLDTQSLNSMVTDSAAAGSTWGSGCRVNNGSLNVLPDGTKLTTIAELTKSIGKKVGLVTTTEITHATPASFAVAVDGRSNQEEIAVQYLNHTDFLMGGGQKHFFAEQRSDSKDMMQVYRDNGFVTITSKTEFNQLDETKKTLGLFYPGHLPYTVDHINSPALQESVPTLAEMTQLALAHLNNHPEGFLLQVEGGRVDHAAHGNDAAALLWDQLAFDDAVNVALEFARAKGDTLVIITSDHGNANPGLNGIGTNYEHSTTCFETLARATASYDQLRKLLSSSAITTDACYEVIKAQLAVSLNPAEAAAISDALNKQLPCEINNLHRNPNGIMGQALGNHNGIGWTGTNHTSDNVILFAEGPGQELFNGLIPNYQAFDLMTGLWDINFQNPVSGREAIPSYKV